MPYNEVVVDNTGLESINTWWYRYSNSLSATTLCVRSVDMQKPLCAFHTLTVVSLDADITKMPTHYSSANELSEERTEIYEMELSLMPHPTQSKSFRSQSS